MTIARIYRMVAAEGKDDEMAAALTEFVPVVSACAGSQGAETMRDIADPRRFLFIERWDSVAAHKAAAASLPREWMLRMQAAIAAPPEGSYEQVLPA